MMNHWRRMPWNNRGKPGIQSTGQRKCSSRSNHHISDDEYDECGFANDDALNRSKDMLYVKCEIDRRIVEALVDSGASNSVISYEMMSRLDLTHKFNPTIEGDATGVGSAKIIGVLENVLCIIGPVKFRLFFMVLDASAPFLILGLDQLKRFQCCINLEERKLTFGGTNGVAVPFLTRESAAQSVMTIFMTNQQKQHQARAAVANHQNVQHQATRAQQRRHQHHLQRRRQKQQYHRPRLQQGAQSTPHQRHRHRHRRQTSRFEAPGSISPSPSQQSAPFRRYY